MRLIHTLQARASCIGSRHREGITEVDRFYMHQRGIGRFFVLSFFLFLYKWNRFRQHVYHTEIPLSRVHFACARRGI